MLSNSIIGVISKKGNGKSYFVKTEILAKKIYPRQIILDTQNEYNSFGVIIEDLESLRTFLLTYGEKNFSIVYKLKEMDDTNEFFHISRQINNYCLIIEEIHLFCDPHNIQEDLRNSIALGRHKQRSLVYISQRPAQLNKLLTSQSDLLIIVGPIHEPADLQYFRNMNFSKPIDQLEMYERSYYGNTNVLEGANDDIKTKAVSRDRPPVQGEVQLDGVEGYGNGVGRENRVHDDNGEIPDSR